jgi:uncharacterized protein
VTTRTAADLPGCDAEVRPFLADLGLDGIVDLHVHAMPHRLQQAVWAYFDRLERPAWPIAYRHDEDTRLRVLADLGVVAHTALAYAHRPGMLDWLNDHTLGLAERVPAVLPTFTIFPQPDVGEATARAIARGGAVVKVHTQVGRFHTTDPLLDDAWTQISAARLPVVLHATAVYGVDGGAEFCGVDAVRALLDRHPHLTVVLAHLGMPDHADAVTLVEQTDDLHLDTAMTLHGGELDVPVSDEVRGRLHDVTDRIVFGSDFPTIPHDYATQVRALAALELDDAALRQVLAGNARRLLERRMPPGLGEVVGGQD